MSPLFHRTDDGTEGQGQMHGHLPSLLELGPQLDEVVKSAAALPLEQFAAQLMTRYFTTDYMVASQITGMVAVDTICWDLLPDNSGEHAGEPKLNGLVTTRRGRSALAAGTIEQILDQVYARPA
jgi:hypothetical protein